MLIRITVLLSAFLSLVPLALSNHETHFSSRVRSMLRTSMASQLRDADANAGYTDESLENDISTEDNTASGRRLSVDVRVPENNFIVLDRKITCRCCFSGG